MPEHLTLQVVDLDGSVKESLDEARSMSRLSFLTKALAVGGTIVVGGVLIGGLPKLAFGAPSAAQDADILNFALLLEYLEAGFYAEAVDGGALTGETLDFATTVLAHEQAHVDFLKTALGSAAIAQPTLDFKGTTADLAMFQATAMVLEDTGVAAYNGQGPNLTKKTLGAAAQIVSVEARHAAWIRDIVKKAPAPDILDPAKTKDEVTAAVTATGFITS